MSNCIRTENQARAAFQSASKRLDPKDRVEYYNSWAETYDKDISLVSYSAPELAVNFLFEHYKGNPEEALVLDVACGTGLVAKRMNQLGFRHFVGVDGSKGMLDKANDTGLYQHLEHTLLGSEPLPAEPGKFDVVMIVGALRPGLVPISVIEELYKAAKPGAYICMSRVNPIPEDADEYKDKMEALEIR
ncbi:methyltransferase-like protein 27 [Cynoglossus semilaevis]|uniref:methyltransferase-like protein 27 n=1 Tax=Cynoglossus semilaevis TaxID=244447 RepID=UPI000D62DAAA|nr:methyltransferase-like protein 27 [Cynoglossus semilaevis]